MTDDGFDELDDIADEFAQRVRGGERPRVDEYVARHPRLADELRRLLPTLELVETFGAEVDGASREAPAAALRNAGAALADISRHDFGDFRIVREIGRGGMGVVYEAEQVSLGRTVALKVLPSGAFLDVRRLKRFQFEARAAAQLHHPHIVPIYEVGEHESTHYYAMQLVRGHGLDAVLDELRALASERRAASMAAPSRDESDVASSSESTSSLLKERHGGRTDDPDAVYFKRVARLGCQAAEALGHAHERGIVHRDVKPSNLLLDVAGDVWVTDFGLAKAEGSDTLTDAGDVVGTLRYMGPERLRGWSDPRSDLFGLGATLYELLTLRPAFGARDRARLVREVLHVEPVAPRRVNPRIPRDLETIVLKTLRKEPAQRYSTAGELVEDLRRFLAGRPIVARRSTAVERLWLACRRNPVIASLASLSVLLLVVVAIVSTLMAWRLENVALESLRAVASRGISRFEPGQRQTRLRAIAEAARIEPSLELRNLAVAALMRSDYRVAERWPIPEGTFLLSVDRDFETVCEARAITPRGFELVVRSRRDPQESFVLGRHARIGMASFSDDGSTVVWGDDAVSLRVWRWREARLLLELSGRVKLGRESFSPDGSLLAVAYYGEPARVFSLATGRETPLPVDTSSLTHLKFAPDGDLIAGFRRDTPRIDVLSLRHESRLSADLPAAPHGVWWHENERVLAVATSTNLLLVWDLDSGAPPFTLDDDQGLVTTIEFQPWGHHLLTDGWDGVTRVWDCRSGQVLLRMEDMARGFRRDGRAFLSGFVHEARVWEAFGGGEYFALGDGSRSTDFTDVSPDGRWLVGSGAGGARIWELSTRRVVALIDSRGARWACFHPDGRRVFTASVSAVEEWPLRVDDDAGGLEVGSPRRIFERTKASGSMRAALSRDGARLAHSVDGTVVVLRLDAPSKPVELEPYPVSSQRGHALDFSSDGGLLAGATWGNSWELPVWDTASGHLVATVPAVWGARAVFSPDDTTLAVANGEAVRVFEVGTWRVLHSAPRTSGSSDGRLAYSPDGRLLAVRISRKVIQLLDGRDLSEILTLETPGRDFVESLRFSRDGRLLVATSNANRLIHVWDLVALRSALRELGLDWE